MQILRASYRRKTKPARCRRAAAKSRRGAALVELSICIVPLFIIISCTIDVCQMLQTRQSALIVAFEGVRVRASRNGTTTRAKDLSERMLRDRGITGGSVSFRYPQGEQSGAPFEVQVSCPSGKIRLPFSFSSRTLSVVRHGVLE